MNDKENKETMKKILVFGRPYSNGGDFLIYDRMVKVLKAFSPECCIELNLDSDARFQVAAVLNMPRLM